MPVFDSKFNNNVNMMINRADLVFGPLNRKCYCIISHGTCVCTLQERVVRWVANGSGQEFNREQREMLIDETVYNGEGSYERSDVEKMDDQELATAWLQSTSDYVQSQT